MELGPRVAHGEPEMPQAWTVSLGEAPSLADEFGISRDEQDTFAGLRTNVPQGVGIGAFEAEAIGVPGVELDRTSASATTRLSNGSERLKPAFREGGTVTAGNSSPMNDGSAACCWRRRREQSAPASSRWRAS